MDLFAYFAFLELPLLFHWKRNLSLYFKIIQQYSWMQKKIAIVIQFIYICETLQARYEVQCGYFL